MFKRIKCGISAEGHVFQLKRSQMIHAGMRKMLIYHCVKCEKEKTRFV